MKDNQVRQQARPKRNNYYANDNKKSYNKNNYQDAIVEVWDGVIAKIKSAFGI